MPRRNAIETCRPVRIGLGQVCGRDVGADFPVAVRSVRGQRAKAGLDAQPPLRCIQPCTERDLRPPNPRCRRPSRGARRPWPIPQSRPRWRTLPLPPRRSVLDQPRRCDCPPVPWRRRSSCAARPGPPPTRLPTDRCRGSSAARRARPCAWTGPRRCGYPRCNVPRLPRRFPRPPSPKPSRHRPVGRCRDERLWFPFPAGPSPVPAPPQASTERTNPYSASVRPSMPAAPKSQAPRRASAPIWSAVNDPSLRSSPSPKRRALPRPPDRPVSQARPGRCRERQGTGIRRQVAGRPFLRGFARREVAVVRGPIDGQNALRAPMIKRGRRGGCCIRSAIGPVDNHESLPDRVHDVVQDQPPRRRPTLA